MWSRGGSFEQGLAAALDGEDLHARPPTERTVRRWWQERPWLTPPVAWLPAPA